MISETSSAECRSAEFCTSGGLPPSSVAMRAATSRVARWNAGSSTRSVSLCRYAYSRAGGHAAVPVEQLRTRAPTRRRRRSRATRSRSPRRPRARARRTRARGRSRATAGTRSSSPPRRPGARRESRHGRGAGRLPKKKTPAIAGVFRSSELRVLGYAVASAFALIASNSAWVIAPESSRPLAFSISAAAPPLPAVVRT